MAEDIRMQMRIHISPADPDHPIPFESGERLSLAVFTGTPDQLRASCSTVIENAIRTWIEVHPKPAPTPPPVATKILAKAGAGRSVRGRRQK